MYPNGSSYCGADESSNHLECTRMQQNEENTLGLRGLLFLFVDSHQCTDHPYDITFLQ